MKQLSIWGTLLLVNGLALAAILVPALATWHAQGVLFFVFEVSFLLLVFLPTFLYQRLYEGRPLGEALTASLEALLTALSGWA